MNTTRILTIAVTSILLTILIISCNQESSGSEREESTKSAFVEELGQINRDFAKALSAKDPVAAAMVYDENASILPPGDSSIIKGRTNIEAIWQFSIDAGVIDHTINTIDAKSNGDLGYEIGTYKTRFYLGNNDTLVTEGKYTKILERNEEGKWAFTYYIWNIEPIQD